MLLYMQLVFYLVVFISIELHVVYFNYYCLHLLNCDCYHYPFKLIKDIRL